MQIAEADIVDIFSSIQGEGLFVGARQVFVRFRRCNLNCSYCDEPRNAEPKLFTPSSLMAEIERLEAVKGSHHSVSLTGGEPLLYGDFLGSFLPFLARRNLRAYLETNGTLPGALAGVIDLVDIVAMDIKLPSSTGERPLWPEHAEFLQVAARKNVFVKAVVTSDTTAEDIRQAAQLVKGIGAHIPFILQPATRAPGAVDKEPTAKALLKFIEIGLGYDLDNVSVIPQVHKLTGVK